MLCGWPQLSRWMLFCKGVLMSCDRDQITDLVHQSQLETIDKCSVCLLTIHEWKKKRREKVSWFLVVTRRDEQSSFPN